MTDSEVAKVARVVSELNLKTGCGVWIRLDQDLEERGAVVLCLDKYKVITSTSDFALENAHLSLRESVG